MADIHIQKADGTKELFNEDKLRRGLTQAGFSRERTDMIVAHTKENLYDGITSAQIDKHVSEFLQEREPALQGKYHLKQALMQLGPTGYPFERFVGQLLRAHGFDTEVGVIMMGKCVSHEIDVLAKKNSEEYFVECKYHNFLGARSDVKTVLYVKARGDDLREKLTTTSDSQKKYQSWVVTNTKFSQDAVTYGRCAQVLLTGWNYPEKASLQIMVESKRLYPITCLTTLNTDQKALLITHNLVLVKDVVENMDSVFKLTQLEHHKKQILLNEARVYI